MIMGSNMAEAHPIAFRFVMQARQKGATVIHVDPRFTRTSAMADIYAPIRAGSDIAFLGGIINFVINNQRWQTDPFFKTWLLHYTNGVPEWPYNGFVGEYDRKSWQYAPTGIGAQGHVGATAQSGEVRGA